MAILGVLLLGSGLLVLARGVGFLLQAPAPVAMPMPTSRGTPEQEQRLIPTPTAAEADGHPALAHTAVSVDGQTHTPEPTRKASVTLSPTSTGVPQADLLSPRQRIGFVVGTTNRSMLDVERYNVQQLGAGWYLSCAQDENPRQEPAVSLGMDCAQLVVVTGNTYRPELGVLQNLARRQPGRLWLVGNEPDVIWQGNSTPQQYAEAYHDVYRLLKDADPTCHVAIGAISQVTPLRLRYLEAVLAAHRETYGWAMPVDVWNIHLAILREERGTWGVDLPPGMPDDTGLLYEVQDNANIEILKEQVLTFRRWMARQGFRDKPLIVSEFSVLMPPDYGFPFERVRDFMISASDFFMTAADGSLGYPADGYRLVQRWAWYSLADKQYYTGNLLDPETGQITPLGRAFADYAAGW